MVLVILRALKIWYAEVPYPSPVQETNYGSCMKSVLPTDLWDYNGDLWGFGEEGWQFEANVQPRVGPAGVSNPSWDGSTDISRPTNH